MEEDSDGEMRSRIWRITKTIASEKTARRRRGEKVEAAGVKRRGLSGWRSTKRKRGDLAAVKKSSAHGVDVNERGGGKRETPLYVACDKGHLEVVNAPLSTDGININQANMNESHHCTGREWPFGSCECTVKYGWDQYQSSQYE